MIVWNYVNIFLVKDLNFKWISFGDTWRVFETRKFESKRLSLRISSWKSISNVNYSIKEHLCCGLIWHSSRSFANHGPWFDVKLCGESKSYSCVWWEGILGLEFKEIGNQVCIYCRGFSNKGTCCQTSSLCREKDSLIHILNLLVICVKYLVGEGTSWSCLCRSSHLRYKDVDEVELRQIHCVERLYCQFSGRLIESPCWVWVQRRAECSHLSQVWKVEIRRDSYLNIWTCHKWIQIVDAQSQLGQSVNGRVVCCNLHCRRWTDRRLACRQEHILCNTCRTLVNSVAIFVRRSKTETANWGCWGRRSYALDLNLQKRIGHHITWKVPVKLNL